MTKCRMHVSLVSRARNRTRLGTLGRMDVSLIVSSQDGARLSTESWMDVPLVVRAGGSWKRRNVKMAVMDLSRAKHTRTG